MVVVMKHGSTSCCSETIHPSMFFFLNDPPPPDIYPLPLPDALPILLGALARAGVPDRDSEPAPRRRQDPPGARRHRRGLGLSVRPRGSRVLARPAPLDPRLPGALRDRKSTRLNSSH